MTQTKTTFAALAIVALMAGCGGGGGDPGGDHTAVATSSISRAAFVKQANAICAPEVPRLAKAVSVYQDAHLDEPSVKTVSGAARAVVRPALEAQADKIRTLGAPRGAAAEIEKYLAALLSGVDEMVAKKPKTFEEAQAMLEPAAATGRRLGLDRCNYSIVTEFNEKRNRARARARNEAAVAARAH